jgi:hypothetical protein
MPRVSRRVPSRREVAHSSEGSPNQMLMRSSLADHRTRGCMMVCMPDPKGAVGVDGNARAALLVRRDLVVDLARVACILLVSSSTS